MDTHTNSLLLSWRAPARATHQRSERWYVLGGVFCLIFIAYGILTGAWSLSIVFATIPGLYFLLRSEKHRDHTVAVYESGIEFDGTLYQWDQCKEFWILTGEGYHELHVAVAK